MRTHEDWADDHGHLPLEYCAEYDAAAEHFARHGCLPDAMGVPGALTFIQADPEAFDVRVKDFKYAHAMQRQPSLEDLAENHFNTVTAFYHDAYAEWQVKLDGQRRTFDDCRYEGWGATLAEAIAEAMADMEKQTKTRSN